MIIYFSTNKSSKHKELKLTGKHVLVTLHHCGTTRKCTSHGKLQLTTSLYWKISGSLAFSIAYLSRQVIWLVPVSVRVKSASC